MPNHEAHPSGYERGDARVRPLAWFGLGLSATVVVVALAMVPLFRALRERARGADAPPHPMAREVEPPPPRLQVAPPLDLEALRRREAELLERYGWVDRERGIARIPVERAMELVLERGLPARRPR
jgi:hypothetical protein